MTLTSDDVRLLLAQCMEAPKPSVRINFIEYFDKETIRVVEVDQNLDEHCVSEIVDLCIEYVIKTVASTSHQQAYRIPKGLVTRIGYELTCNVDG